MHDNTQKFPFAFKTKLSHVRFRDSFDFVAGLVLKRTVWLCSGQEIILIAWQVYIQQQKLGEKFLYIFTLYIFSF